MSTTPMQQKLESPSQSRKSTEPTAEEVEQMGRLRRAFLDPDLLEELKAMSDAKKEG